MHSGILHLEDFRNIGITERIVSIAFDQVRPDPEYFLFGILVSEPQPEIKKNLLTSKF